MNSYQLKTMLRAPISARARIGRYTRKLIERRLNAGAHGNPAQWLSVTGAGV